MNELVTNDCDIIMDIEMLSDALPIPPLPSSKTCTWSFDSESRVLLGKFKFNKKNQSVMKEDESTHRTHTYSQCTSAVRYLGTLASNFLD